jgi:hypothetical protein
MAEIFKDCVCIYIRSYFKIKLIEPTFKNISKVVFTQVIIQLKIIAINSNGDLKG